jgi:hypothetical protein
MRVVGRGKREEGRGKREEGRGKREEGRGKKFRAYEIVGISKVTLCLVVNIILLILLVSVLTFPKVRHVSQGLAGKMLVI